MLSRSSGTVCVDGDSNIHSFRTSIGFCPQHNFFIPFLSCLEHLLFFGQLRGLSKHEAAIHAERILDQINLSSKANDAAHTLSGGLKRRLSLANAIIGETKLLVLDEPSSGLDPESRREIWDVLLVKKKIKTLEIKITMAFLFH
jgi:ATP-binding cassette, subfamily A (ABC1), member 3